MQWERAKRLVQESVYQNHSTLVQDIILPNNPKLSEKVRAWETANGEIFEWWCIDDCLAEKLKNKGECTIEYGFAHWWGRPAFGQLIAADGTIREIAEELYG
jgi:hypothetical protein